MTRREERIELLNLLFQYTFYEEKIEDILMDASDARDVIATEYIENAIIKISENTEEIDSYIIKNLKGWKFERISKISLCIMRIAIYEILNCEDIPTNVSISEAVVISKLYTSDEDKSFINGVLSSVSKEFNKADEQ